MSGGEKQQSEITDKELQSIIAEEMTKFLERNRVEIVEKALERLKKVREDVSLK